MITLHHLVQSRSLRVLWLLEELGEPYELKSYLRNPGDSLAPEELKAAHPLGKSPVIEIDGLVLAESGAITEYLIDRFAPERLAPARGTPEFAEYLQWIHFAESSIMVPLLLKLFVEKDGGQMNLLPRYAESELKKLLAYLNAALEGRRYLVADKLSGADFMLGLTVQRLLGEGVSMPNFKAYAAQLMTHASLQRALEIEAKLAGGRL